MAICLLSTLTLHPLVHLYLAPARAAHAHGDANSVKNPPLGLGPAYSTPRGPVVLTTRLLEVLAMVFLTPAEKEVLAYSNTAADQC